MEHKMRNYGTAFCWILIALIHYAAYFFYPEATTNMSDTGLLALGVATILLEIQYHKRDRR